MRFFAGAIALLGAVTRISARDTTFQESLTLKPTADGKLSVLFEFTTTFPERTPSVIPTSHHTLTPPALLLPLEKNNVSSMTMSFVSGRWDTAWGAGPLEVESGGGGGEVRGWLKHDDPAAWTAATHALGGLFCAGLGPKSPDETTNAFGRLYPGGQGTHFYTPTPPNQLCTENLTPFLKLLPSKGLSGLSKLLANPGVVMAWGFRTEGIEVVMPNRTDGRWTGWWEGVVDLVPHRGGSRAFSIESLFKSSFAKPFPLASASTLRLISSAPPRATPQPSSTTQSIIDGESVDILTWDLLDPTLSNVDFTWDEGEFQYTVPPQPLVTIHRSLVKPHAADGELLVRIVNRGPDRAVGYTEMLPWWLKTWVSEIKTTVNGQRKDVITGIEYTASLPSQRPTTLLLTMLLPPNSTTYLSIPYSKQTIKYTEHRPDAERGIEIPSGTLVFLDGDQSRPRIYTAKSLLDLPTPDFSMPYNVIIMTCTVLALFFGSVFNLVGRKWGIVVVP